MESWKLNNAQPESSLCPERNKEIKDILDIQQTGTYNIPKLMWHYENSAKRKVQSTKSLQKEGGEISHWWLHRTPENPRTKSSRQNRIKLMAEINKIETRKIIQRINEIKSWSLRQQDRQILIQINQKAETEYPNWQNQKWKGEIMTDIEEI